MVSPQVSEITVATTEVFPLKKEEKTVKPGFKPLAEEKKNISQKTTETKKSIDGNKKTKREKRDESSDSSDSESSMLYFLINIKL